MVTYTIDKRPKRLRDGDKVVFVVGGARCVYSVWGGEDWLPNDNNEDVFGVLGMTLGEKISMIERSFGYVSHEPSFWPSSKARDFAAHCRLVNALYDLIEERDGKKAESCSDNATDEPGIFLGYDWAHADRDLNRSTEINGSQRYATFEEAAESAKDDSGVPFYVFKLYAVDVKKYSYKLVQED